MTKPDDGPGPENTIFGDSSPFLERALSLIRRELLVTPLCPGKKRARLRDWQLTASCDEQQIRSWASEGPNDNVGVVCTRDGIWILDVDVPFWLVDEYGMLPTFAVKTGGEGLQFYFQQDDYSRRKLDNFAVPNPEQSPDARTNLCEVLHHGRLGVGPGSIHPNGRTYKVIREREISVAPRALVDWLLEQRESQPKPPWAKSRLICRRGWDPQIELQKAGLKFSVRHRGELVWLNYHVDHGVCLVQNKHHQKNSNRRNNELSGFAYDPKSRALYHHCHACQEFEGQLETALRRLGVDPTEVEEKPEWRKAFENYAEMPDTPLAFVVEGFMPEDCATAIGALSGHGKTFIAMSIAKAVIEGRPLFGYFNVPKTRPVLYLIPESGRASFRHRMELFGLIYSDDRFLCRTYSMGPTLKLTSPEVLSAAAGRVVILDTAIRFREGEENSASDNQRELANAVFQLLQPGRAVAVLLLHHSPKYFREADAMTLENVLRGSGDAGAMVGACYGVRQINPDSNLVHVECVKPRDFQGPKPFQLQGRPYIDEIGDWKLMSAPGETPYVKDVGKTDVTKPVDLEFQQAVELFEEGKLSQRQIARRLRVNQTKVSRWSKRWQESLGRKPKSKESFQTSLLEMEM